MEPTTLMFPRSRVRRTRVLLAHHEGLVRAGLRALLEREGDLTVVGAASSGEDVVALAAELHPDVVLMDARLPGLDALQATRRIVAEAGGAPVNVLILGDDENDDELFGALHAGASGYLVDEAEPVELLRAIRSVADGQALLSPSIARRLIDELASQPNPHAPVPERLEELTAREREVMGLVALGFSNREIAARLVVSAATAKTHVSRAMIKLHARDRAQLVALAYQTRLVEPRRSIERGGLRGLVAA
ncbi:MAG TPA: response regulator transcription factor [Solirubrobacteraceae bacterium]|jgi:DNA-binding NarL/FixJ family response regulator|nr:response regulator transcription factor [Solirubrobacteraceae bacterium]